MFCTKCGKETDGKSNFCNYCGATLNNQTSINTQQVNRSRKTTSHSAQVKKKVYQQWWFWVIVVIIGLGIIGSLGRDTTQTTSSNTSKSNTVQTSSKSEEEIIELDYNVLYKEYQDNAIAADGKYKGKILQLEGKIEKINREIAGNPFVTFRVGEEYSFKDVRLTFKKSEEEKVSKLAKGQTITVKGKCSGQLVTGTVSLHDCEIIK